VEGTIGMARASSFPRLRGKVRMGVYDSLLI
jgi:hypothetical protein